MPGVRKPGSHANRTGEGVNEMVQNGDPDRCQASLCTRPSIALTEANSMDVNRARDGLPDRERLVRIHRACFDANEHYEATSA